MTEPDQQTSSTLLARVAAPGDDDACAEFFRRHSLWVKANAQQLGAADPSDITQDTIWAVIRAVREQRYDKRKGRLRQFIRAVTRHKISDAFSRRRKFGAVGDLPPENCADSKPTPEQQFSRTADAKRIRDALATCFEELRLTVRPLTYQAFVLRVIYEWPVGKIAKHLGISRNQVSVSVTRVRSRLRTKLERIGVDRTISAD